MFWGTGSIVLHGLYAKVLTKAYDSSDFSLVYPIARGLGPLITVFIGICFLGEMVGSLTLIGAIFILLGMYILHSGWNLKLGLETLKTLYRKS